MATFFDSAGRFSQERWINYWSALWSAPGQPGFATLVREGLASLSTLAQTFKLQAQTIGAGAAEGETMINEVQAALPTYIAIAGATQDGQQLATFVTTPLLTEPNAPLLKLGLAMQVITQAAPLRSWGEIFQGEIAEPMGRAAKAVGQAATRTLGILPIAIGLGVIYLVTRDS